MKPNSENMIQDIYNVQRLDLLDEWNIKYLSFFSEKKFWLIYGYQRHWCLSSTVQVSVVLHWSVVRQSGTYMCVSSKRNKRTVLVEHPFPIKCPALGYQKWMSLDAKLTYIVYYHGAY